MVVEGKRLNEHGWVAKKPTFVEELFKEHVITALNAVQN
jgi:hypothetical protein